MAKYTNDELLEAFGEMTLVELSEFVKAFEEKFDVEAAAPVAAVAAAPAAGAAAEEEKDEFDVILSAVEGCPGEGQEGRRREGQVPARRSRRHRRAQVIRAASSRNHQAVMETPFAVRQRGFPHMEHDSGMF